MRFLILPLLFVMSACQAQYGLAELYGVQQQGETLQIEVMSNGCTRPTDFSLRVEGRDLLVLRNQVDQCRRMPHLISLELTMVQTNKPLQLRNSILLKPR